tara:strand:- start:8918 stop:9103 length:186 start_codon:yes stop_codon:yes gene_type:complete
MSKWTEKQQGALWKKDSQNGKYLSGYVKINGEDHKIVIFPNKYKKEAKHPEFIIYSPFEKV